VDYSREELEERDGDDLAVRSDGLLMLARPDQQAVIVVPECACAEDSRGVIARWSAANVAWFKIQN
jgi:hypothetical protein